jgi:hypothetical protein
MADRYRLGLRSGWWQDAIQVEALAAFICWLELYDSGANADPTGKLQLLWELERLRGLLRAGEHAFHASRDRAAFDRYVRQQVRETAEARPDDRLSVPACKPGQLAQEADEFSTPR